MSSITNRLHMSSAIQKANRDQAARVSQALASEIGAGFTLDRGTDICNTSIAAWIVIDDLHVATDTGSLALRRSQIIDDPSTARDIASAGLFLLLQPLTSIELQKINRAQEIVPVTERASIAGMF